MDKITEVKFLLDLLPSELREQVASVLSDNNVMLLSGVALFWGILTSVFVFNSFLDQSFQPTQKLNFFNFFKILFYGSIVSGVVYFVEFIQWLSLGSLLPFYSTSQTFKQFIHNLRDLFSAQVLQPILTAVGASKGIKASILDFIDFIFLVKIPEKGATTDILNNKLEWWRSIPYMLIWLYVILVLFVIVCRSKLYRGNGFMAFLANTGFLLTGPTFLPTITLGVYSLHSLSPLIVNIESNQNTKRFEFIISFLIISSIISVLSYFVTLVFFHCKGYHTDVVSFYTSLDARYAVINVSLRGLVGIMISIFGSSVVSVPTNLFATFLPIKGNHVEILMPSELIISVLVLTLLLFVCALFKRTGFFNSLYYSLITTAWAASVLSFFFRLHSTSPTSGTVSLGDLKEIVKIYNILPFLKQLDQYVVEAGLPLIGSSKGADQILRGLTFILLTIFFSTFFFSIVFDLFASSLSKPHSGNGKESFPEVKSKQVKDQEKKKPQSTKNNTEVRKRK